MEKMGRSNFCLDGYALSAQLFGQKERRPVASCRRGELVEI